ncbi:metallophosphoesterase family protein [Sphingobacterium sp. SGG-5]|uniref:metallophosphoesterase family protein n=1 Tax=Sphingobacterium sp. SGG-5 TaxID=2710881 RepID=UPI0019D24A17|nr:metallophosphoesterase [Sphingobacterium sp. SGG-5]
MLMAQCRKPFQFSLLEVRPLVEQLNLQAIARIGQLPVEENFSFLLISDTQIGYKQLKDFVTHANTTYSTDDIAFVLHGGDITDFGASYEYNDYFKFTERLKFPIVATIGNHDMLGNGTAIYRKAFGPENFTFDFGKNRFIVFNSNSRERAFDGSTPDLGWIRQQLDKEDLDEMVNIFYLSHIDPLSSDFDPALSQDFAHLVADSDKARLVMNGHAHAYHLTTPFQDNLPYLIIPAIHTRSYVKVDVADHTVNIQLISY